MSIKKRVESPKFIEDLKREIFINNGGQVKADQKDKVEFSNILIRVPNSILKDVGICLSRKPWMNRTQWVMEAIVNLIEDEL